MNGNLCIMLLSNQLRYVHFRIHRRKAKPDTLERKLSRLESAAPQTQYHKRLSKSLAAKAPSIFLVVPSLTLRIATVAAEVTAAGVFELAVAFGADADHLRHNRACYWVLSTEY